MRPRWKEATAPAAAPAVDVEAALSSDVDLDDADEIDVHLNMNSDYQPAGNVDASSPEERPEPLRKPTFLRPQAEQKPAAAIAAAVAAVAEVAVSLRPKMAAYEVGEADGVLVVGALVEHASSEPAPAPTARSAAALLSEDGSAVDVSSTAAVTGGPVKAVKKVPPPVAKRLSLMVTETSAETSTHEPAGATAKASKVPPPVAKQISMMVAETSTETSTDERSLVRTWMQPAGTVAKAPLTVTPPVVTRRSAPLSASETVGETPQEKVSLPVAQRRSVIDVSRPPDEAPPPRQLMGGTSAPQDEVPPLRPPKTHLRTPETGQIVPVGTVEVDTAAETLELPVYDDTSDIPHEPPAYADTSAISHADGPRPYEDIDDHQPVYDDIGDHQPVYDAVAEAAETVVGARPRRSLPPRPATEVAANAVADYDDDELYETVVRSGGDQTKAREEIGEDTTEVKSAATPESAQAKRQSVVPVLTNEQQLQIMDLLKSGMSSDEALAEANKLSEIGPAEPDPPAVPATDPLAEPGPMVVSKPAVPVNTADADAGADADIDDGYEPVEEISMFPENADAAAPEPSVPKAQFEVPTNLTEWQTKEIMQLYKDGASQEEVMAKATAMSEGELSPALASPKMTEPTQESAQKPKDKKAARANKRKEKKEKKAKKEKKGTAATTPPTTVREQYEVPTLSNEDQLKVMGLVKAGMSMEEAMAELNDKPIYVYFTFSEKTTENEFLVEEIVEELEFLGIPRSKCHIQSTLELALFETSIVAPLLVCDEFLKDSEKTAFAHTVPSDKRLLIHVAPLNDLAQTVQTFGIQSPFGSLYKNAEAAPESIEHVQDQPNRTQAYHNATAVATAVIARVVSVEPSLQTLIEDRAAKMMMKKMGASQQLALQAASARQKQMPAP